MKYRCLTNNPYIIERYQDQVESFEGGPLELFIKIKGEIMAGYRLVTHPLTGSIGPSINPYKSVILTTQKGSIDEESLHIIEQAIIHTTNLLSNHTKCVWDLRSKKDFQELDFDFVKRFFL